LFYQSVRLNPTTNLPVKIIGDKFEKFLMIRQNIMGLNPGGPTIAKILETLRIKPQNTNQLAHLLEMDYKTVKHHLDLLKKNKIVVCEGEYGPTYFLSQTMEDNYGSVEKILKLSK